MIKLSASLLTRCTRSLAARGYAKTTHFGFQTVTEEEKSEKVHEVFTKVAEKYDLMNDVMSAGVHRLWKQHFISQLKPIPGSRCLDVAGGTGDIAFRLIDHIRDENQRATQPKLTDVTICDINENMLAVGERRAQQQGYVDSNEFKINWVHGDAMKLPFEDNQFDCYTIAFGIRNVVDIEAALKEAHRVLKPGGVFSCMEFSKVTVPVLESIYNWYSFNIIPVQGEILAGDWKSYQYLVESIRRFPDQEEFKSMISEAGFRLVNYENLTFGISAIHTGYKLSI